MLVMDSKERVYFTGEIIESTDEAFDEREKPSVLELKGLDLREA
jgi:hypothetical protein